MKDYISSLQMQGDKKNKKKKNQYERLFSRMLRNATILQAILHVSSVTSIIHSMLFSLADFI